MKRQARKDNAHFCVQFGSPNAMGDTKTYHAERLARQAVEQELKQWRQWCATFNKPGVVAVDDGMRWIDKVTFSSENKKEHRVELDSYTGQVLVIKIWKYDL